MAYSLTRYNIYNKEAEILEKENGTVMVIVEGNKKDFPDYEKAVYFLEKIGYRL